MADGRDSSLSVAVRIVSLLSLFELILLTRLSLAHPSAEGVTDALRGQVTRESDSRMDIEAWLAEGGKLNVRHLLQSTLLWRNQGTEVYFSNDRAALLALGAEQ